MLIYITSELRAAVSIHSEASALFGTDRTVFRLEDKKATDAAKASETLMLIITPATTSGRLQICAELDLDIRTGALTAKRNGISIYDWSCETEAERVFELVPDFPASDRRLPAELIDKLDFEDSETMSVSFGGSKKVSLYRDDGLRLMVEESGREKGFIIGEGENGSLKMLDAGFERFIICHAVGCKDCDAGSEKHEKLIVLNDAFEHFGTVSGSSCFIEDGLLTAIDELGTALGHQSRRRYELCASGLRPIGESERSGETEGEYQNEMAIGEVGFFTHPQRRPDSDAETALALLECLLLGRENEALSLLTSDLKRGLDFDGLCKFFGDFDEARTAPFATEEHLAIVGAVHCGCVKAFGFDFENGLISDVSELDRLCLPHGSRELPATETAVRQQKEPE